MANTLPNGDMVHEEIEAQSLAERYLMGQLSLEESGRFEEHFVDCPRCGGPLERRVIKASEPERLVRLPKPS